MNVQQRHLNRCKNREQRLQSKTSIPMHYNRYTKIRTTLSQIGSHPKRESEYGKLNTVPGGWLVKLAPERKTGYSLGFCRENPLDRLPESGYNGGVGK